MEQVFVLRFSGPRMIYNHCYGLRRLLQCTRSQRGAEVDKPTFDFNLVLLLGRWSEWYFVNAMDVLGAGFIDALAFTNMYINSFQRHNGIEAKTNEDIKLFREGRNLDPKDIPIYRKFESMNGLLCSYLDGEWSFSSAFRCRCVTRCCRSCQNDPLNRRVLNYLQHPIRAKWSLALEKTNSPLESGERSEVQGIL